MRSLLQSIPIISTVLLAVGMAHASANPASDETARMDRLVRFYVENSRFMGAVLVARGDTVLLNKGYGFANLEWKIPHSSASKFRIASITKQFTAACILLLQEQGKLKLGDPVKKYLPEAPEAWDKITIYNLLTHTSGIADDTGSESASMKVQPATPRELVAGFIDRPLQFPPGEKMSYSNSGYAVLGLLIEKISGQPYAQFLQYHIFTPLGMQDTGYDSNKTVIEHRAAGYSLEKDGFVNADLISSAWPYAAGGLYSTTGDLLRWERALFGGKLLSAAPLKTMTAPFKGDYACGLYVVKEGTRTVIRHSGGIDGFRTVMSYYPDTKVVVIVLANLRPCAPEDIAWRLAAVAHRDGIVLASDHKEISVPAKMLEDYVGVYEAEPGRNAGVSLENGRLMLRTGSDKMVLYAESKSRFFARGQDGQLEFRRDDRGRVTSLVYRVYRNGQAEEQIGLRKTGAERILQLGTPIPGDTPYSVKLVLDPDWGDLIPGDISLVDSTYASLQNGNLEAYVHGAYHPELHTPFKVRAYFGGGAQLTLHLNSVATAGAVLEVDSDGSPIYSQPLKDKDGLHKVNNEFNQDIVVNLPEGKHTIEVKNTGNDWFFLDWIRLTQVLPAYGTGG